MTLRITIPGLRVLCVRTVLALLWALTLFGAVALGSAGLVRYPERLSWVGNRDEVLARIPRLAEDGSFRFLYVGDPEDGGASTIELLRAVQDRAPAFLVIGGDLVKYPTEARYGYFLSLLEGLGWEVPTVCAVGNSDVSASQPHLFERFIGPKVFRFEVGGCLFAFFDDAEGFVGEDQIRPMDEFLARERSRFRIVFFVLHRPLFTVKEGRSPDWQATAAQGNAAMLDLIRRHHVEEVLCGHLHGFLLIEHDGTKHIVSGGGGGDLQQEDVGHHLLEFEVGPGSEVRQRMVAAGRRRPALGVALMDWHAKILPWVSDHMATAGGAEMALLALAVLWSRGRRRRSRPTWEAPLR